MQLCLVLIIVSSTVSCKNIITRTYQVYHMHHSYHIILPYYTPYYMLHIINIDKSRLS